VAEAKMPEKLGRYEVVRELGKGAMGVVYEGKDPNIGRRVAIKTARREVVEASGMADEMMERFLREAQAAGALNHPNIITIYDAAEENGMAYIAMEFLEGGDLGDIIESKRKLSMEEIVEIGANICEALEVAHSQGVVHRDIKPANILMPTDKPLKVADFGIAHVSDSNLTQDGALIGTPHYMSPEQFMGQKLDGRSDLFSVGNILYELTTGEKPFGGEALSTVMHHVIKTDPVNPTELNFAVPDALAQVIMTSLSKRPAGRYVSGQVMANALRESLKEHPDGAKLSPGGVGLAATMAGAAAPPPQETVIGGAPAGDATLPGGAPAGQDATMAGGPPAGDATMPGGAPAPDATVPGGAPAPQATLPGGAPAPEATAPGGPPPPAASAPLESTAPGSVPPPAQDSAAAGPNKGLLVGGGIAAAVVLAIVGMVAFSGGSDKEPTAPPTSSGAAGAVTEEPHYSSFRFEIWRAQNPEDYRAFNRDGVAIDALDGRLDPVKEIAVTVKDQDGNVVATRDPWDPTDLLEFPPDARPKALRYTIVLKEEGIERDGDIPLAKFAGESALMDPPIVLPAPTPES